MACFYCSAPLAWRITAGNRASRRADEYREVGTCAGHVDRGRTWASAAGPPTAQRLNERPPPHGHPAPAQQALFQL